MAYASPSPSSSSSYIVNIATDVGNGKINTGVNFYSKPISFRQVIVAAEELYTAELRDFNAKKFAATAGYNTNADRSASAASFRQNERFQCVVALIMRNPNAPPSYMDHNGTTTRGSSMASSYYNGAATAGALGGGGEMGGGGSKWEEFSDVAQLYPNCQLYVFDKHSPAAERGVIPRAQLVVDADRVPFITASSLAAVARTTSSAANANNNYQPIPNGNAFYTANVAAAAATTPSSQQSQSPQPRIQQEQNSSNSNLPHSPPTTAMMRDGGRYPNNNTNTFASANANQQQLYHQPPQQYQQQTLLPPPGSAYDASNSSVFGGGGGARTAGTAAPTPLHGLNTTAPNTTFNNNTTTTMMGGAPEQLPTNNQYHHHQQQQQAGPSSSSSPAPPAAAAVVSTTATASTITDRVASRQYLFRQLRDRCVATGQSNYPQNDSIPAQYLHGILVQNEMFFATDVFADMTSGKMFISGADWAVLEEHFAPVLDVLYDRIAAKTSLKTQHYGADEDRKKAAERMQNRMDELAEEEAKLMARQAAIREEMARLKRDLQRAEQQEKVAKDEKAKEWDVLNKYVGLKLRQHKLRREEMQINHQLALL